MCLIFNDNKVPEIVLAHQTLLMILISTDLHINSYEVNLKSPKFLDLSSVCALILLIKIPKFLFSILPLKCFCTTIIDINLYTSPLRVPIQFLSFLIWQSLPEEIAEKFLWLFLHYFGNFTSQMSSFLQIGTVVGLAQCPLQAHVIKTGLLEGCQGIVTPWQGLFFHFLKNLMLWTPSPWSFKVAQSLISHFWYPSCSIWLILSCNHTLLSLFKAFLNFN